MSRRNLPKILIIDDDPAVLSLYKDVLSPKYEVTIADDWLDGTNLLGADHFDLLILDLRMMVFDPVVFIQKLRSDGNRMPILVCSAYRNLRERVAGTDVNAIMGKPFDLTEFERTVSELVAPPNTEGAV